MHTDQQTFSSHKICLFIIIAKVQNSDENFIE